MFCGMETQQKLARQSFISNNNKTHQVWGHQGYLGYFEWCQTCWRAQAPCSQSHCRKLHESLCHTGTPEISLKERKIFRKSTHTKTPFTFNPKDQGSTYGGMAFWRDVVSSVLNVIYLAEASKKNSIFSQNNKCGC